VSLIWVVLYLSPPMAPEERRMQGPLFELIRFVSFGSIIALSPFSKDFGSF
jgi:hypothetical protein